MREDWIECCFEDLLDYEQPTKYIVKSTNYNDSYEMPVLTAGKTFIKGYTNETDGIFENLPTIIFDDFTTATQYVNFKFKVKSSAMKILVPTSKLVNMPFTYFVMQVNQVRSDTHKRYWISVFAKKEFLLPPLVEQKAIVKKIEELFSSLDSGIADLKKAQDQLVIYKQAVLKKAFEGELTKEWREKQTNLPSADELLEQIKEERKKHYEQQLIDWKKAVRVWETNKTIGKKPVKSKPNKVFDSLNAQELKNLFALSKQFKWVKIGEICSVKGGKRLPKGHKFAENKTEFVYIMAGNLKDGTVKNELTYIYEDTYNELYRYTVNTGDIYITIVGACIGDAGIIPKEHNLSILTENAAKIITTISLSNKYLSFWLNSLIAQIRIKGSVFSATLGKLALSRIELLEIPICSKQEQEQIVKEIENRLSVCDKVKESITASLQKAQALRQSILKKAFEGKLLNEEEIEKCKTDKDYEPASVLLERIKGEKL
tara:strand:- start:5326 stop:6786 length:1461 start_codon:yes stop_codon:yes gene_type:complete